MRLSKPSKKTIDANLDVLQKLSDLVDRKNVPLKQKKIIIELAKAAMEEISPTKSNIKHQRVIVEAIDKGVNKHLEMTKRYIKKVVSKEDKEAEKVKKLVAYLGEALKR